MKKLKDLEEIVGKISKDKKLNKIEIEKTSEIEIKKIKNLIFEKRKAKISVTFRSKASHVARVEEILKEIQLQDKEITKTDIYNLVIKKGLEALGF